MKKQNQTSRKPSSPEGENLDPNRQLSHNKPETNNQGHQMNIDYEGSDHKHQDSENINNVSGYFGQDQPNQDLLSNVSAPQASEQQDEKDEAIKQNYVQIFEDNAEQSVGLLSGNLNDLHQKSGQQQFSHKKVDTNQELIKSSESKKEIQRSFANTDENLRSSENERGSILGSNGDCTLECVENIHLPNQQSTTHLHIHATNVLQKNIQPSTPNTSSQQKDLNQVNINEIVLRRQSPEKVKSPLPRTIKNLQSGQKDLMQQAQRFTRENLGGLPIQSPLFVQERQNQLNMSLAAFSQNKHRPQPQQRGGDDFFDAISNNTENKLNQVSAQQQTNSHAKPQLQLEKQISFAPQLSPVNTRSPFGSHANASRIGLSPPKDQTKDKLFDSDSLNKLGLKVMPILNRASQNKNGKECKFMISPSPVKKNGSPSVIGSSSKGRQLYYSPDPNNYDNVANVSPSAAKRFNGSNTPNNAKMFLTRTSNKEKSSIIHSNFKINGNSLQKREQCSSKQASNAFHREHSNIKKLNYGDQMINGVDSNNQTQEVRYTKQIMGEPTNFTHFGGSNQILQQQLFPKNQNGLNCPTELYSPAFMSNQARNPYKVQVMPNQFSGTAYDYHGDLSPGFPSHCGKSRILSSKFTVGQDQGSAIKSSAAFMSSHKNRRIGQSSQKKNFDSTIQIPLPSSSSKLDKTNSNMKSSGGSGSYTSGSQSSSGNQSSSENSSNKPAFHQMKFENGFFTSSKDNYGAFQSMYDHIPMMDQMHPYLQHLNQKVNFIHEYYQNHQHFHCLPTNKEDIRCTCGLWKEAQKNKGSCVQSDCSSKKQINIYHQPVTYTQQNYINTSHQTSITQGDLSNVNFNQEFQFPVNNQMMHFQKSQQQWNGFNGMHMPQNATCNQQSDQGQSKKKKTQQFKLGKRTSTATKHDHKIENPETPVRAFENVSRQSSDSKLQNTKKRSKKDSSKKQSKCDDDLFDKPSVPSRPDSKVNQTPLVDIFHQTPQKGGKKITVTEAQVSLSQMKTGTPAANGHNDTNRKSKTPSITNFNLNLGENNAVSADKIRFHHQNPKQFDCFQASHFDCQIFGTNNSNTAQYDSNSGLQVQNQRSNQNASTTQKVKSKKNDKATNQNTGQSIRRSLLEKEQQQKQKEEDIKKMTEKIMGSTKTQADLFEKQRKANPAVVCAGCKCKNNQCLKLYCVCLANNATCGPECQCKKLLKDGICKNNEEHTDSREKAIVDILGRNIYAFQEKIIKQAAGTTGVLEVEHRTGCNCKKSKCQKNYCECFERGLPCNEKCKCENCKNVGTKCGDHQNNDNNQEKQEAIKSMAPSTNSVALDNNSLEKNAVKLADSIDKIDLKMNDSITKTEEPVLLQFQSRQFNPDEVSNTQKDQNEEIIEVSETKGQENKENKQIKQKTILKVNWDKEEDQIAVYNSINTYNQESIQVVKEQEATPPSKVEADGDKVKLEIIETTSHEQQSKETKDKKPLAKKTKAKKEETKKDEAKKDEAKNTIVTRSKQRKQPQE